MIISTCRRCNYARQHEML